MGLAASQARFLAITARKNTCELKSMQIAQEKLSITNQLTQAAENYQNSLDATKLVWDSEYITDGSIYDVSYSLLMTPSLLNGYSPQLLTDNKNRVVLDSQYAAALKSMGTVYTDPKGNNYGFANLETGGADRTEANFRKFLLALNNNGILSEIDYNNMISALDGTGGSNYYRPDNGLGGDVLEKFATDAMNLSTLKSYINTLTDPTSSYMNELYQKDGTDTSGTAPTSYDKAVHLASILNFEGSYTATTNKTSGTTVNVDTLGEYYSKQYDLTITDSSFNLADLLNKEITLSSKDEESMADAMAKFVDSMYQIMTDFFALDTTSVDQDYLNYAMYQICTLNGLTWDSSTQSCAVGTDGKVLFDTSAAYSTGDSASKHTCVIKNGSTYSLSLSNFAKGLITYFEKAVEGFDSGYSVESTDKKKTENSFYITQDPEYYYLINNPEICTVDDETQNLLDFYSQMFNQICAHGWTENNLVNDDESLKIMLKNGTIFSTTLADDGNFYQGPYTSNNYIAEVTDEDAITKAEAEYKVQQLTLNAKEEELDIDLQEIDAELSALTTEYDSVKQMISKSVEKGFSTLGG